MIMNKNDERIHNFYDWYGYDEDGNGYAYIGNTYPVKDRLKNVLHAKWNPGLSVWVAPININMGSEIAVVPFKVNDAFELNSYGNYDQHHVKSSFIKNIHDKADKFVNQIKKNKEDEVRKSYEKLNIGYVGNVGQVISATVVLDSVHQYDSYYGYNGGTSYIYIMEDEKGQVYKWSTSVELPEDCYEDNVRFTITGKVKEHKEYRGVPQTVLTRCKITDVVKF